MPNARLKQEFIPVLAKVGVFAKLRFCLIDEIQVFYTFSISLFSPQSAGEDDKTFAKQRLLIYQALDYDSNVNCHCNYYSCVPVLCTSYVF